MVTAAGPANDVALATGPHGRARREWLETLGAAVRLRRTQAGIVLAGVFVLTAIIGPYIAPHSPTAFIGAPFSGSSSTALFGTDALGRDVLSRFLCGGRTVIVLAVAATVIGVTVGALLGAVAAYGGGWLDSVLMRSSDVVLAFPQIVLVLLVVTETGPHLWIIVLMVAIGHMPRTARVIRGAAVEVVERDFIRAADAMGERRWRIIVSGVMPMVTTPLLVEYGLRMVYSIGIAAGLSFLGFGLQPPAADWGLMINENRLGIAQNPWSVGLPVLAIALLTVGTNMVTDGIARAAIGIDRRAAE